MIRRCSIAAMVTLLAVAMTARADFAPPAKDFLQHYCSDCHDADSKKGGLDLSSLKFDLHDSKAFAEWVKVHDRVRDGEMPPKKKARPPGVELTAFLRAIGAPMTAADQAGELAEGRATLRRMNRYEYENTLRDLLHAPWLQVKDMLPEDGESHRFNKVGDAMDVSHVQMARYLNAADYALRQAMATQAERPPTRTVRYYARQQGSFIAKVKFTQFNGSPERATFPMLGTTAQPDVMSGLAPMTVGKSDPLVREQEAMGVVASSYEPIELQFNNFKAPVAGFYKLRLNAFSFWAGPQSAKKWWRPDRTKTYPGRRSEPITLYSDTRPRLLRWLGAFDVGVEPAVHEVDAWLLAGETIRPDAARLFRSRPPNWHNPLAEKDGQPGVAFRWLEAEGPIYDQWPPAGHQLLFGDLKLQDIPGGGVEVVSDDPKRDADRLMRAFVARAYRRPAEESDIQRFLGVVDAAMASGSSFTEAMIAGYSTVLCSPGFIYLEEAPGKLDDYALAERLSYFLWNSEPDIELRELAERGELHKPDVLDAQTDRLLNDPRSRRFVDAFLDYWLDLRKIETTSPDGTLYNDYYLDDLLVESAKLETQTFFAELLRRDLPARNIVSSDFAMLNERLARHYGLPPVDGVAIRPVKLPQDSVRGGLMTQASVLKVTANGTTTSPVLRGAWIMERILGKPPPRPPPSVPAIEPDTRGAVTIRQQLEKHRTQASCSACHAKIDPAGFALENFDVMGGWRDAYRAVSDEATTRPAGGEITHPPGYGKNGQPFLFHYAQPVDASGVLPDGRAFKDIRDLKRLLLSDERQIARNLSEQFVVYATGAPIRFGDRPRIEQILDRSSGNGFGVRSLIHGVVQSELFQFK